MTGHNFTCKAEACIEAKEPLGKVSLPVSDRTDCRSTDWSAFLALAAAREASAALVLASLSAAPNSLWAAEAVWRDLHNHNTCIGMMNMSVLQDTSAAEGARVQGAGSP